MVENLKHELLVEIDTVAIVVFGTFPTPRTPGVILAVPDIFKRFAQFQPKLCSTTYTVSAIMNSIWLTYTVLDYMITILKVLLIALLVFAVLI